MSTSSATLIEERLLNNSTRNGIAWLTDTVCSGMAEDFSQGWRTHWSKPGENTTMQALELFAGWDFTLNATMYWNDGD